MMNEKGINDFFQLLNHPFKFRLFLLKNLPSAYFAGVRVVDVTKEKCITKVPYKWFSTNPFRSTYFACLSMAAEMSTGVLAMAYTYGLQPSVSMLVTSIEGRFHKKATGITFFSCDEGDKIQQVVQQAYENNESQQIIVSSKGTNKSGELVAEFFITWSFKRK
jgi:hypothetical protein